MIQEILNIPAVWGIIYMVVTAAVVFLFWIFKTKNVKFKDVEIIEKTQKELYRTEGKNTLDNQCCNAHNLIKTIWIDLFETGKTIFNITDTRDLFLLEDITHLIESKLNYEVKNDLTKNHITEKSDYELAMYSEAKAHGYYNSVKASLYYYNSQLPEYNLPDIMENITVEDFIKTFKAIYFGACKIAGGKQNG